MNPNIKVINKNLWLVNQEYVKAGYIKELSFLPESSEGDFHITDSGKIVLNDISEADAIHKFFIPAFKIVMGFPEYLLNSEKGFLEYIRAIIV